MSASAAYDQVVELMQAELERLRAEIETLKHALQAVEGGDPVTLTELFAASVLESHQLRRRVAACPRCSQTPPKGPAQAKT